MLQLELSQAQGLISIIEFKPTDMQYFDYLKEALYIVAAIATIYQVCQELAIACGILLAIFIIYYLIAHL